MDAGGTEDGAEARCPVNHLLVGTSEPRGDVVEGPHGGAAMSWRDRRRCEALTFTSHRSHGLPHRLRFIDTLRALVQK